MATISASTLWESNTRVPPSVPPPSSLLLAILSVLGLWAVLARWAPEGEVAAVGMSLVTATVVWILLRKWWKAEAWATPILRVLDFVLLAKVSLGLLHFYLIFAPAGSISSASDLGRATIHGDLPPIDHAARVFLAERASGGLFHALFGDYYREINNPGVEVVYGLLYGAFGPYATVAIPWNAFAMGLSALAIGAMGRMLGVAEADTKLAALATVLLPTFFISPPLYRDQFMVLLILVTAYTAVHLSKKASLKDVVGLVILGVLLGSLRAPLAITPALALAVTAIASFIRGRPARGLILLVLVCVIAFLIVDQLPPEWLPVIAARLEVSSLSSATSGRMEGALGTGIAGKAAFLLFTPMPWYQSVPTWLLAHQVFDYAETIVSLAVVFSLASSPARALRWNARLPVLLLGVLLFVMALFAEELHQRYAQIALPLVIFGGASQIRSRWKYGSLSSVAAIAFVHIVLLVW